MLIKYSIWYQNHTKIEEICRYIKYLKQDEICVCYDMLIESVVYSNKLRASSYMLAPSFILGSMNYRNRQDSYDLPSTSRRWTTLLVNEDHPFPMKTAALLPISISMAIPVAVCSGSSTRSREVTILSHPFDFSAVMSGCSQSSFAFVIMYSDFKLGLMKLPDSQSFLTLWIRSISCSCVGRHLLPYMS